MITITVEYLHGVMRANSGEAIAGSSGAAVAEWPPSPARLFGALVAGGGTAPTNRISSDDSELRLIEAAAPPLIAADRNDVVRRSELCSRFVVIDDRANGRVQEYPGRKAGMVRPGARVSLRSRFVTYAWPELEGSPKQVQALKRRAARVGYLGCSDSPVRLSVNDTSPMDGRTVWSPADDGVNPIAVPYVGYLDALDRAHRAFINGASPRASRIPRGRVAYRTTEDAIAPDPEPTLIWLSFDRAINGRLALSVGEALQGAVLSQFDRSDAPAVLHGHNTAPGAQHARFVPLPDAGFAHSRGRIHGAVIWLPADTPAVDVGNVRVAANAVSRLTLKGSDRPVAVAMREPGQQLPWATNPRRWTEPSHTFATAFPAVHERFGNVVDPTKDVAPWCRHAGIPEPVEVRMGREPFIKGAEVMPARNVWRKSTRNYPFSHLWLRFAEPITGPIVLGRGRTHGLGLLVPVNKVASRNG